MPSVQFLFSTTDGRLFAQNAGVLAVAENPIVVNQLLGETAAATPDSGWVANVRERGLARSRNRAIAMSDADACYLCDDDVGLVEAAPARVASHFDRHPTADVIVFGRPWHRPHEVGADGPGPRPWSPVPVRLRALGVLSVQIGFRRAAILEHGLRFDERFGLGTDYPTGAEAIFLSDCLRADLRIVWVDEVIATHPEANSGANYANPALAEAKGAVLARVFGPGCRLWFLPLALKSYRLYQPHIGFFDFLRALERGARHFFEATAMDAPTSPSHTRSSR